MAIFISHDLGVVRYIADRVVIMQHGRVEEVGTVSATFLAPSSEYTKRLLDAAAVTELGDPLGSRSPEPRAGLTRS